MVPAADQATVAHAANPVRPTDRTRAGPAGRSANPRRRARGWVVAAALSMDSSHRQRQWTGGLLHGAAVLQLERPGKARTAAQTAQVGIDHLADHVLETDGRLPTQLLSGFAGVALQDVDLG